MSATIPPGEAYRLVADNLAKVDGLLYGSASDYRENVAALSGLEAAEPAPAPA